MRRAKLGIICPNFLLDYKVATHILAKCLKTRKIFEGAKAGPVCLSGRSRSLFRCARLFRGLHKCIGELVDVFIHNERGHRVIQRVLERFRSSFTGNTA